jgi:predicted lipoprotein with Yx(FWY)xxD motif
MSLSKRHHPGTHPVARGAFTALLAVGGLAASAIVATSAEAGAGAASGSRGKSVFVTTSKNAIYGTILVSGTAVYTVKAAKTSCGTTCLKVWPEVLLPKGVKKAKAGTGVAAGKLGTVKRRGGALQVTYNGKALYWFSGDTRSGQVKGNIKDKWGAWSVVVIAKPAALQPIAATTTAPPTTTTLGNAPAGGTSTTPTVPPVGTTPSFPPVTTPTTAPPASTTTVPPTTTTTAPPTTTTTTPGGGGVGF